MSAETMLLLGRPLAWHPFLFIAFFATLLDYGLHRFIGINRGVTPHAGGIWMRMHRKLFYFLLPLASAGLITCLFFAKNSIVLMLIPLGMLTLGYSLPAFRTGRQYVRISAMPGIKIVLLILVWTITTVWLPAMRAGEPVLSSQVILLSAERLLFLLAVAIPFDIRDTAEDARKGLRTLPVLAGTIISRSIAIAAAVLFILTDLLRNFLFPGTQHTVFIALLLSAFITIICILLQRTKRGAYYYYGVLDGMLILQFLFVYWASRPA